ncbi:MAG TPA: Na+-transporting methylmalonyl-CoA/oxaloacetate decarboxylase subunit beta [Clostridiales bacterium]|nr:Na+-transporting methylmalonyl-CoA/oxaloacetate decarboxylase subunit beta [Clostridiales bacterium]
MKIFFNSSLWSKGKGCHGSPQKANLQFEYSGTKRCIPIIYRFPRGIVFDVITILDESKLRTFYEKYEHIQNKMTSVQKRSMRQENPFQNISLQEIRINGKKTDDGFSSSSMMCIPWLKEDVNVLEDIKKEYAEYLKGRDCFAIERFCVRYPKSDSIFQKLLRFIWPEHVNRLHMTTEPHRHYDPLDITIHMSTRQKEEHNISFAHPLTGMEHTLYLQQLTPFELPLGNKETNTGFQIYQASYEISPPLSKGETLMFDNRLDMVGDVSIGHKEQKQASAIGIIGGADGPTSIIVGKKENHVHCGKHGFPLSFCYSIPSDHRLDTVSFVIQGIERTEPKGKEYGFIL